MAALDTFDWYAATLVDVSAEVLKSIKSHREYLLTLRSEDEQQRFVESAIAELRQLCLTGSKGS